ncbi:hypothetical protein BH09MYX1_BH09MYX1_02410 [soil metagenome]
MRSTLVLVLLATGFAATACGGSDDVATPSDSGTPDVGVSPDTSTPLDASPTDAAKDSATDALVDAAPVDDPGPGPTTQCTYTKDADGFFKLTSPKSDYIVRLPPAYNLQNPQPTRLLVSLHGCGDTAMNHATWAAVPYALRTTQDYIAISLGGREGACWNASTDSALVFAAIAHVRTCFYVHQKKVVLAGYSSGGDLTYLTALKNASMFAGILIEHSDITQNVGANNVASTLAGASWKLNVAISAGINDGVYPIATVRGDRDKMITAGFPVKYEELPNTHDGTSDDWAKFLIPKMATWVAP